MGVQTFQVSPTEASGDLLAVLAGRRRNLVSWWRARCRLQPHLTAEEVTQYRVLLWDLWDLPP